MITPARMDEQVEVALGEVLDPELGLSIIDLGLVYGVDVDPIAGVARITMTTTSPVCPLGEHLARAVRERVGRVPGIDLVEVRLVEEPPWSPERMSERARSALRM